LEKIGSVFEYNIFSTISNSIVFYQTFMLYTILKNGNVFTIKILIILINRYLIVLLVFLTTKERIVITILSQFYTKYSVV